MTEGLLVMLYTLGSILLVVLIILGIKLIITMDKIDKVVDNISAKAESLNGVFSIIDSTTNKLALISDKMADTITALVRKIFNRKKEEEENE